MTWLRLLTIFALLLIGFCDTQDIEDFPLISIGIPAESCSCQQQTTEIPDIRIVYDKKRQHEKEYKATLTAIMKETTHFVQYSYDLFKDGVHIGFGTFSYDVLKHEGQIIEVSFQVKMKPFWPKGSYGLVVAFYDDHGLSVGCGKIMFSQE